MNETVNPFESFLRLDFLEQQTDDYLLDVRRDLRETYYLLCANLSAIKDELISRGLER